MNKQKYISITESIREYIKTQNFLEGSKLPSEKKLGKIFDVNHLTIRKALKLLEDEKIIHKIPCRGNYVGKPKQKRNKSNLLGLIFPENDPFFFNIQIALEEKMSISGYSPLIHISYWSPEKEKQILDTFQRFNVDGIIAVPNKECSHLYQNIDIPTVFFDTLIDNLDIPYVVNDDYQGACSAVEYLISMGHQEIAYIGGINDHTAIQRLAGFRDTMQKHKLHVNENKIKCQSYSRQWGYSASEELFKQPDQSTAIFCGNDAIAAGALNYMRLYNIPCPEKVSVIGFSNSQLAEDIGLSTVEQQTSQLLDSIWRNLQLQLKGQQATPVTIIPTRLIIRNTTTSVSTK